MAGGIGEDSHDGHGDLWNHLLKQGSWCITIPNNAVLREYPSKLPYILHCLIPPQNGCFYDPCFVKCFNNHHTYISYGRSFHTSPLGPQKGKAKPSSGIQGWAVQLRGGMLLWSKNTKSTNDCCLVPETSTLKWLEISWMIPNLYLGNGLNHQTSNKKWLFRVPGGIPLWKG